MRVWRRHLGERLIVNLDDKSAIRGRLDAAVRGVLEFREAEHLRPGAEPIRVDGRAIVNTGRIIFAQVIPES